MDNAWALPRLDDLGHLSDEWTGPDLNLYNSPGYYHLIPTFQSGIEQQAQYFSTTSPSSPPPLPRRRFIDLPPEPDYITSIHSVLACGHPVDADKLRWDVRTRTSNFHPSISGVERRVNSPSSAAAVGSWRAQDATMPAMHSISICVEGMALGFEGWTFEVTPRYGNTISVQDVLETVYAQCSRRGVDVS